MLNQFTLRVQKSETSTMADQDSLRTDGVMPTHSTLRNSSEQLTSVPMISYSKKSRSNNQKEIENVNNVVVVPQNNRKVLAHRKKLQEFYKLHSDSQEEKKKEDAEEEKQIPTIEKLQDPELLAQFVKDSSAQEMLKVRNEIALKLNFHDLEKKTIIYDNYSELIKLDQTLASVKQGTLAGEAEGFFLLQDKQSRKNFVEILEEAQASLKKESTIFNQDFRSVIEKVLLDSRVLET